ncbi:MAG: hypothetical protein NC548_65915 [Lachnospiraceae bacterium]|nr:hypothetical protein [Lachnospiraceae bacterium]MCM1441897.1 hypothetical protein [Roseburia sp.]
MDTSKKYYEDRIRDYNKYKRGRTLAQYCRDEGIDYDWMQTAKRKYSGRTQQTGQEDTAEEDTAAEEPGLPTMIKLHYQDDAEEPSGDSFQKNAGEWKVGAVTLTDPDGNEITISSGSAAALGNLLTKISRCHA